MNTNHRHKVSVGPGIDLSYLDRGQGDPLLFIHGFTGTATSHLGPLLARFESSNRIIAPDLRGYGASRPPNRDFPPTFYERDAADMANLLDMLKCEPVVVLGFSDGAEVAILLAATRPDLIRGVIAWGVSGVISAEELANVERWLPVSSWGPERSAWKEAIIRNHGAEQFEPMINGWVSAARTIYTNGGNICYHQAAHVACPVLLLNGDGEVGNTVRDVSALAARIPNCQLVFIPNSSHAIQNDQPESLFQAILRFLAPLNN